MRKEPIGWVVVWIAIFCICPIFCGVLILRQQQKKGERRDYRIIAIRNIENKIDKMSDDEILGNFSDFNSAQKEWFLKTTIFLMESDPQIRQKEIDYISCRCYPQFG